jgi:outer membrane protein OmpA-like peptidoglycan-associated protein
MLSIGIPSVLADCQDIRNQSQTAISENNLNQMSALYSKAQNTADCSEAFISWLGKETAIAHIKSAMALVSEKREKEAIVLLNKSLTTLRHWMALAMLGDVMMDRKDFANAAVKYQEALDIISQEELTPDPPKPAIIGKIFKKAEQCRLLADTYIAATKNRAGEHGGLSRISFRGFAPARVAVPITFPYDSSEFTEKGEEAATDMLEYLKEQKEPDILLIGHTDPSGDAAYNLALSEKRVRVVKQYLKRHGYKGRIKTEGRGEKELYPVDTKQFSEEEYYRMCRRVVLKR